MKAVAGRVSIDFDVDPISIRDPIFGTHRIGDPLLVALLSSSAVTRLKGVHQAGASYLVRGDRDLSRYDHSVGVMLGVRGAGGSREEQVAGLLHDVSHTAFSHVIDHVVADRGEAYHEHLMQELIARTEIPRVLALHGMDITQLLNAKQWPLLDQPAPDLCMDRIDYTLRDLLHCGRITQSEVAAFVGSLQTEAGRVVVDSLAQALWFVQRYYQEVTELFMDPVESYANACMAEAIRLAMEQGVITNEDLFLEDEQLLDRLRSAGVPTVIELLERVRSPLLVSESQSTEGALHVHHKYRVVDPIVQVHEGSVARCSELDARVGELHSRVLERARRGTWLRYVGPLVPSR